MVCRLIESCLFVCIIVQCSAQTDLVGRCETCREVVRNFKKACNVLSFVSIDCASYTNRMTVWKT